MRSDNLGYTLLLGVMLSFVAAVTIPLGYGLIVFLRGLDEQSRTKYNVALPITMFVVGFVFSAFPLPKLPGGVIRAREQAWDDYFDRENPQPMDERIGNEASLARMTALGAVEAVCYQLARAAGEVDNLGLPPPKKDK